MNDANMKKIREFILSHALDTQNRLPPDSRHPKGRNAIAHYYSCLNSLYHVKETRKIHDNRIDEVMLILNEIYRTADDVDSFDKLTKPKNIPQELSLNEFLM